MDVQKRIALYITDNGIKQSFVADRTGIDKAIISAIMTGKRRMSADEYELIVKALNKTPNDFMLLED